MWEVGIRPGRDSVPLAGGLFNREVYLEGELVLLTYLVEFVHNLWTIDLVTLKIGLPRFDHNLSLS